MYFVSENIGYMEGIELGTNLEKTGWVYVNY